MPDKPNILLVHGSLRATLHIGGMSFLLCTKKASSAILFAKCRRLSLQQVDVYWADPRLSTCL